MAFGDSAALEPNTTSNEDKFTLPMFMERENEKFTVLKVEMYNTECSLNDQEQEWTKNNIWGCQSTKKLFEQEPALFRNRAAPAMTSLR